MKNFPLALYQLKAFNLLVTDKRQPLEIVCYILFRYILLFRKLIKNFKQVDIVVVVNSNDYLCDDIAIVSISTFIVSASHRFDTKAKKFH